MKMGAKSIKIFISKEKPEEVLQPLQRQQHHPQQQLPKLLEVQTKERHYFFTKKPP
jgi:hypothetical protein